MKYVLNVLRSNFNDIKYLSIDNPEKSILTYSFVYNKLPISRTSLPMWVSFFIESVLTDCEQFIIILNIKKK